MGRLKGKGPCIAKYVHMYTANTLLQWSAKWQLLVNAVLQLILAMCVSLFLALRIGA